MATVHNENLQILDKRKESKSKSLNAFGDIAIKKATLLGSAPTEDGTMGEGLMAGANRMAQSPHQNAWTGLVEGLMRGFGMGLKGKEAAEKRKQVEDTLDVLNYTMQANEDIQKIQQQMNKSKQFYQALPNQEQWVDAVKTGTLEETLSKFAQQQGIEPQKITLSSDKMTAFIDDGKGNIQKVNPQEYFNRDPSQKFSFANTMVKENLTQSNDEKVRGLAQQNLSLESKLAQYEKMYRDNGANAQDAHMMAQNAVRGEETEQQKLGNETMTAEARALKAEDDHKMFNTNKNHKQAYIKDVDNRWDGWSQYNRSFGQEQGKEEAKRIGELEEQNLHFEDKKWQIKELQDMLKGNKVITGSTLSSWVQRAWGSKQGWWNDNMSETEAFDALSKNLLGFVKGDVKFGNMNQKEFEWLAKQTPDSTMTKGGIERILNRLESSIDRSIKRNETEMKRRPNFNPYDTKEQGSPSGGGNQTTTGAATSTQGAGEGKGSGAHTYQTPDGKEWQLTPEQYNKVPAKVRGNLTMVQ